MYAMYANCLTLSCQTVIWIDRPELPFQRCAGGLQPFGLLLQQNILYFSSWANKCLLNSYRFF